MNQVEQQLQRERFNDEEAALRTLQEYAKAALNGNIDGLPRTKVLIGKVFQHLVDALKIIHEDKSPASNRGVMKWFKQLDPEVIAIVTLRRTLTMLYNKAADVVTFQQLTKAIGGDLEAEVLIKEANAVNPVYVDRAIQNLRAGGTRSENHIRRTMQAVCENVLNLEDIRTLSYTDRMHLGKIGLNALIELGVVNVIHTNGSKGSLVYYELAEEYEQFLDLRKSDVALVTDKSTASMICPPQELIGPTSSGYYTHRRKLAMPCIKISRGYAAQVLDPQELSEYKTAFDIDKMPLVYDTCNYLQSIPFELKTEVYDILADLWQEGGGVLGVPRPTLGPKPTFPFAEDWDKNKGTDIELEEFAEWKRRCRIHYTAVAKNNSHVLSVTTFLKTAKQLKDTAIWHPVFLDWRGRVYYRGVPNPQGTDIERAVLHFHDKKELGTQGIYWLKVHIANSLGYDKETFDNRVKYVDDCWPKILRELPFPADSNLFRAADNPFCAIAACIELKRALESPDPTKYKTGIVVHMDATCSGLQHFSAMLRDEIGGSYVNLVDIGKRADIYQRVADLVVDRIKAASFSDDVTEALYASIWSDIPINRNVAKKPVMTYVYGATTNGIKDGVLDYLAEVGWHQPDVSKVGLANYLTKVLLQAIEDTVPAAAKAMKWIRKKSGKYQNKPFVWKTPLGFPVYQIYAELGIQRVRVRSCGVQYVINATPTGNVNTRKMRNASAPNFVHSLDASHLLMTAQACKDAGLQIVTIHDSFGTHPSDVGELLKITKDQFIKLYRDNDILGLIDESHVTEAELTKGKLELEGIRNSPFFFT
jgi:DNA-directed RNA polymerase